MKLPTLAILGAVACCAVLTACSGPSNATPPPSAPAATSAAGAPKVSTPIDASKYYPGAKGCALLSTAQLQALKLRNARTQEDTQKGYGCQWRDEADNLGIDMVLYPNTSLSWFYNQRSTYQSKGYFQPTSVAGQPALYEDQTGDDRSQGQCNMAVGLSDQTAFEMDYLGAGAANGGVGSQSCTLLTQAATDVVQALKNGGK